MLTIFLKYLEYSQKSCSQIDSHSKDRIIAEICQCSKETMQGGCKVVSYCRAGFNLFIDLLIDIPSLDMLISLRQRINVAVSSKSALPRSPTCNVYRLRQKFGSQQNVP